MALFFGISERSFARYKKNHGEFWQSIRTGEEMALDQSEQALHKRAIGYKYRETEVKKGLRRPDYP